MGRPPGTTKGISTDTEIILARWRRYCALDWTTEEIARQLGMNVATLRQRVYRARKAGHPAAVLHPRAAQYTAGTGIAQAIDSSVRARQKRRMARGATA